MHSNVFVRFGFPCEHYFRILCKAAEIHQINPQYWLLFQVFYNSPDKSGDIGNILMAAQHEQYTLEGRGIPIDENGLDDALQVSRRWEGRIHTNPMLSLT